MSLVEVVVAMTLMTIFGAMFTTGILTIYHTNNKVEAIAESQTQVTRAVTRLDQEIRYAAGISTPAVGADGNAYVEFLVTNTGTPTCVQLRVEPDTSASGRYKLKRRTWPQGGTVPAWSTASVLMTGITTANPFSLPAADPDIDYQRLRFQLAAQVGTDRFAELKATDITFTALNSSTDSSNSTVCTEGRP